MTSAAARGGPGALASVAPVVHTVPTRHGPARVHVWESVNDFDRERPITRLILGHGAGGGVQAPDLHAIAVSLSAGATERRDGSNRQLRVQVVLIEQPWRVAGRRIAPRPAVLDEAWLDVLGQIPELLGPAQRTIIGGRSAGARVCARTADLAPMPIDGVLLLAFPLQPIQRRAARDAGRQAPPARTPELIQLANSGVPVVVVQGDLDPFGAANDITAVLIEAASSVAPGAVTADVSGWEVVAVAAANHEFRARVAESEKALDTVVQAVRDFLLRTGVE